MKKQNFAILTALFLLSSCGNSQSSKGNRGTDADSESTTKEQTVSNAPGVDLGLSVNWAECNVGAEKPEETGYRIPLGNTSGSVKAVRGISTHVSNTQNDIAVVKLGDGWRMPTGNEMTELIEKCVWTAETVNGRNGFRITGPNGNSIFLPNTGDNFQSDALADYDYRAGDGNDISSYGNYWCGTPVEPGPGLNHLHFNFSANEQQMMLCEPISLNAVRPVHDK